MKTDLTTGLRKSLKRLSYLGVVTLIVALSSFSSQSTTGTASAIVNPVGHLPDKAQADLDFLHQVLEKAHPGLYRYATKAEMDRGFAAQRAKLGHPMGKSACYEILPKRLA